MQLVLYISGSNYGHTGLADFGEIGGRSFAQRES